MARGKQPPNRADLFRAPIITARFIIRESNRGDAGELERTMDAAHLTQGQRTADGARRFDSGLSEVPVWSATRAVCEKGTVRIIGGVVLTESESVEGDSWRIGWWLDPAAGASSSEVVLGVEERLRALGAVTVTMQLRVDDSAALAVAEETGFSRGGVVHHDTSTGQTIEFWEYVKR